MSHHGRWTRSSHSWTYFFLASRSSIGHQPNLAIDQTMAGFRGRFGSIQYMPQKPTKWGIKAFTLADAANGYLLNSLVYTGAQTLEDADPAYQSLPQPAQVVMDVMWQYLNKGHHVFTDRYDIHIYMYMLHTLYMLRSQSFLLHKPKVKRGGDTRRGTT